VGMEGFAGDSLNCGIAVFMMVRFATPCTVTWTSRRKHRIMTQSRIGHGEANLDQSKESNALCDLIAKRLNHPFPSRTI
jgi:hypothetical protein